MALLGHGVPLFAADPPKLPRFEDPRDKCGNITRGVAERGEARNLTDEQLEGELLKIWKGNPDLLNLVRDPPYDPRGTVSEEFRQISGLVDEYTDRMHRRAPALEDLYQRNDISDRRVGALHILAGKHYQQLNLKTVPVEGIQNLLREIAGVPWDTPRFQSAVDRRAAIEALYKAAYANPKSGGWYLDPAAIPPLAIPSKKISEFLTSDPIAQRVYVKTAVGDPVVLLLGNLVLHLAPNATAKNTLSPEMLRSALENIKTAVRTAIEKIKSVGNKTKFPEESFEDVIFLDTNRIGQLSFRKALEILRQHWKEAGFPFGFEKPGDLFLHLAGQESGKFAKSGPALPSEIPELEKRALEIIRAKAAAEIKPEILQDYTNELTQIVTRLAEIAKTHPEDFDVDVHFPSPALNQWRRKPPSTFRILQALEREVQRAVSPAFEIKGIGQAADWVRQIPRRTVDEATRVAIDSSLEGFLRTALKLAEENGLPTGNQQQLAKVLLRDPATQQTISLFELAVLNKMYQQGRGRNVRDARVYVDFAHLRATLDPYRPEPKVKEVKAPEPAKPYVHPDDALLAANATLRELVEAYADKPSLLLEMLHDVNLPELESRDLAEFVQRYVGLHADKIGERVRTNARRKPVAGESRSTYVRATLAAIRNGTMLYDEETLQRPADHLIRLSRIEFQADPQGTIAKLQRDAADYATMAGLSDKERSFLQRLHTKAAEHFKQDLEFAIKNFAHEPFGYQREGARFLFNRPLAILADEAGLGKTYQVIAAAETLGLKRVLIVTTASNKNNFRDEILDHFKIAPEEVAVIDASNPRQRREQIDKLGPEVRYVLINYEQLSSVKADAPTFEKLTTKLDLLVVDESHLADNKDTNRAKALYSVQADRKWLLTATPYQNKVERLFNILNFLDPEEFPNQQHFVDTYTKNTAGLTKLHARLQNYMLRRRKSETIAHFVDPETEGVSFEDQLAEPGSVRIPHKIRRDPDQVGGYQLSPAQTELLGEMFGDWGIWARRFNLNLPAGVERVPEQVNPLQKFHLLHDAIYNPGRFGLEADNSLFRELDKVVAEKIRKGEKVILWAFNEKMLDEMVARYGAYGTARLDGKLNQTQKDAARTAFQTDPNTRLLIANYRSGGVGLTLTAAHSAIYVQVPLQFAEYYQSEGRHHRVIGKSGVENAKTEVDVIWMVPRYDSAIASRALSPTSRAALARGTLVEQTLRRLEGGELIYQLVVDGHSTGDNFDKYLKGEIMRSLEGDGSPVPMTPLERVASKILPLATAMRSRPVAEERLLAVIDLLAKTPHSGVAIAAELSKFPDVSDADIELLYNLFQVRSSYIREQLLKKLPAVLSRIRGAGGSLATEAEKLKVGTLTATNFIGKLLLTGDGGIGRSIAEELEGLPNSPRTRYLEDRFLAALVNIHGTSAITALESLSAQLKSEPLEKKIDHLYQLGLLERLKPAAVSSVLGTSDLAPALAGEMANILGVQPEKVRHAFAGKEKDLEAALALGVGYRDGKNPILWQQFVEQFKHIVEGDYTKGRYAKPGFLPARTEWWKEFSKQEQVSSTKPVTQDSAELLERLRTIRNQPGSPEGEYVREVLGTYRTRPGSSKEAFRKTVAAQLELFQEWEKDKMHPGVIEKLRANLRVSHPKAELEDPAVLKVLHRNTQTLSHWLDVEDKLASSPREALTAIGRLETLYRRNMDADVADIWLGLKNQILAEGKQPPQKITAREMDDHSTILNQGQLTEEMVNCFNQNGNPEFTQNVITTLGTAGHKLIVAYDESGKPVGVAQMKVRKLQDGTPVLFLEHGLEAHSKRAVRQQMEELVKQKAKALSATGVKTLAATETKDSSPFGSILLYGTGSYTGKEYSETVWGLRDSTAIIHKARLLE